MAKMNSATGAEQIRELVGRNIEAVNNHDLKTVADTLAPDLEVVGPEGTYKGRDRFIAELQPLFTAFPDYRAVMEQLIVEGNVVAYVAHLEGTHLGAYKMPDGRTIPPTGKRVVIPMVNVRYVRGGKIVKVVNSYDRLGLLAQLGLLPNPSARE